MIYTPTSLRKDIYKILKEGNTVDVLYEGKLWRLMPYEGETSQITHSTPTSNTFINTRTEPIHKPTFDELKAEFHEPTWIPQGPEGKLVEKEDFRGGPATFELPPLGRKRSEIQAELDAVREYRREALEYCQDEEEAGKINNDVQPRITALEQELAENVL